MLQQRNEDWVTMAHNQSVELMGFELPTEDGQAITLYQAEVYMKDKKIHLQVVDEQEVVVLPMTKNINFQAVACLDNNDMACQALRVNYTGDIIQGDITNYEDRRLLHTTPQPLCGMITCGVPCQRLSVQGDGRGNEDERAKPFHAARKACWEQQAAAILLERVPRSGSWEWKSTKRSSH